MFLIKTKGTGALRPSGTKFFMSFLIFVGVILFLPETQGTDVIISAATREISAKAIHNEFHYAEIVIQKLQSRLVTSERFKAQRIQYETFLQKAQKAMDQGDLKRCSSLIEKAWAIASGLIKKIKAEKAKTNFNLTKNGLAVYGGEGISIETDTGITQIKAGQGINLRSGKVKNLLQPPMIKFPLPGKRLFNIQKVTLKWEALDGAQAYRIEVAKDKEFRTILYNQKTDAKKPAATWEIPGDGGYFWRVCGIDEIGLRGMLKEASFRTITDTTPPPLELNPSPWQH